VKRQVCRLDWWSTAPREYLNEPAPTELTYPTGYRTKRDGIDYNQEHLERIAQLL
jgi:hypothetical protein